MDGQHLTRRIVLKAAVAGLALLVTFGGQNVNAELQTGQNHGNKEFFQRDCEAGDGTFIDSTEKDGITLCVHTDGTIESCDKDGNDCFNIPPKPKGHETTGSWGSHVGPIVEATTDVGETVNEAPVAEQQASPVTDDQEPQDGAKHGKSKKSKKRGHGGKGHKR